MKICQEHWDKLRQIIKDKGMWSLVAKSGEEAMDTAVKQLKEEPAKYDPLMSANNMIWGRALENSGLWIMGENEDGSNDGHYCPLCEVKKAGEAHGKENHDEDWMEGCTNNIEQYVRESGFLNTN